MNSKEALCEILKRTDKKESEYTIKCAEIIVKDLEILEIIKSHIIKKTFIMGSDYDEYNTIQFEVAIKELKPYIQENIKCTPITICNNSFTLIKEWLENDYR
ncbi:MAG: hypothetical protein J6W64_07215 [Bacilli bacterium]|nr:hypothetical protein [Bacilli bacterium]